MKYFLIILLIGIISCQTTTSRINRNLEFAKNNLELYKKAKFEIITSEKITKGNSYSYDELNELLARDTNNKFKNLRNLLDKDLITQKSKFIAFDYSRDSLIDFYIWNSEGAIDIISFDPNDSWLERRGVIGQVDDYGFNNLTKIEKNWYFVSTWFK